MAAGKTTYFSIKDLIPALVIISTMAPFLSNLISRLITKPLKDLEGIIQTFNNDEAITFNKKSFSRIKEFSNLRDFIIDSLNLKKREKHALAEAAAAHAEKAKVEAQIREAAMVFAGSIAHDLRTPLATLGLWADTLSKDLSLLLSTQEQIGNSSVFLLKIEQDKLKDLNGAPKKINEIIDQMQVFISETLRVLSRVISGDLTKKDLVKCDSWSCIESALKHYSFESKEEEGLIHWDKSYQFYFLGNQILFIRIIFNLLENSFYQVRKSNRGSIFISARAEGDINILKFSDTVGGVDPSMTAQLFNSYETTKDDGAGVGLAFCKLTMQSFGGDIICQVLDDSSLEFMLLFPRIQDGR